MGRVPRFAGARPFPCEVISWQSLCSYRSMGRMLIYGGLLLVVAGLAVIGLGRLGIPLGRLPGDVSYRGKSVTVFAPIGTSILLSVLLSLALYVISKFFR